MNRERGFTLLELAVFIAIFTVLAGALLERLRYYQEFAEKAAVEASVRGFKGALQIRLAELIIENRQSESGALETENPVQWLESQPANFGGTYPESPVPGTWYFDNRERQLVYVVSTGSRLQIDSSAEEKQLRFKARLVRSPVQTSGGSIESVSGVHLTPVFPYRWQ